MIYLQELEGGTSKCEVLHKISFISDLRYMTFSREISFIFVVLAPFTFWLLRTEYNSGKKGLNTLLLFRIGISNILQPIEFTPNLPSAFQIVFVFIGSYDDFWGFRCQDWLSPCQSFTHRQSGLGLLFLQGLLLSIRCVSPRGKQQVLLISR